jgi:hypothetical protein
MVLIINKKNLVEKKNKYNRKDKEYIKYIFYNKNKDIEKDGIIIIKNDIENNLSDIYTKLYNDIENNNDIEFNDDEKNNDGIDKKIENNELNNLKTIEIFFILDISINIDNIELSINNVIHNITCKSQLKIILNGGEEMILKIKNMKKNSKFSIDRMIYKDINNNENDEKISINKINDYFIKLNDFRDIYYPNKNNDELITLFEKEQEIEYYYFTYRYIEDIIDLKSHHLTKNNYYNAVLIELDKFPHIEFIIRNTINSLGNLWTYTVVCNNENYDMLFKICKKISENIILIKTNIIGYFDESYNNLLLNILFWKSLVGEKILLYNKNSFIFRDNLINNYIKYDYVGNKMFNLRTKSVMVDILLKDEIIEDNEKILKYKNNYVLSKCPEFIYSKQIILNKAPTEINNLFIYKNEFNTDKFVVDKIWINNIDWKKYLYGMVLKKIPYNFKKYENIKYSKYDNLEIILLDGKITDKNIFKNIKVNNYEDDILFVNKKDYLIINGDYDITLENIEKLYEHFNNSYCDILSPVILKNNILEYFGAVINNNGEIINIDEKILNYKNVIAKPSIYSYLQNTMYQYKNLYIVKNINKMMSKYKIYKNNYSKYLNNIKFDPFVIINNLNTAKKEEKIKIKIKNDMFPISLNIDYLKDIYNNYTRFNLISFKLFNDMYYLTTNKQKNILLIEETIITPDKDCGSLYIYYMLETFLRMGYNVHFLPTNFFCDEKYTRNLQKMGIYVCYTYPYSISYHLKNNYNVYDYIFVCRLSSMEKSYEYIKKYCKKSKIIFITHDLNFLRTERQLLIENNNVKINNNYIKENELKNIQKADISIVVSKTEYHILVEKEKLINIHYVPICYDILEDYDRKIEMTHDIYFIGSRHPPNIDAIEFFINSQWDKIRNNMNIKLNIIGGGYDDIKYKYKNDTSIIFHGFISDELLPDMIKKYRINIVPLRYGAGIKGKILQSSNLKIPCISSKIGVEGMELNDGDSIIIEEFDDDFYKRFKKYYNDIDLLKRLSDNAYTVIKNYYSLEKNEEYMRNIFYILNNN